MGKWRSLRSSLKCWNNSVSRSTPIWLRTSGCVKRVIVFIFFNFALWVLCCSFLAAFIESGDGFFQPEETGLDFVPHLFHFLVELGFGDVLWFAGRFGEE